MGHKKFPAIIRIFFDFVHQHKLSFIFAVICVFFTAFGNVVAPLVLQKVTDILTTGTYNGAYIGDDKTYMFTLISYHCIFLGSAYIVSVISGFTYSQIMATTGQTYMDKLRRRMFAHMEDLPVRFFDTHDKGDIMSIYINDVDTIRQFTITSIPEILICGFTFIAVLVIMLLSSIWLTLIVLVEGVVIILITKHIGGRSSKNFISQQKFIGKQEGFVEEMMNGLKVIKSFCHEEESKANFDKINHELQDVSTRANQYANTLMPAMGNVGNLTYVIVAFTGTLLYMFGARNIALNPSVNSVSIGVVVSFLPMVKQFTNNASQVANQINSIALAIGGSSRICALFDCEVEVDDGYVTLVRGKYDENGNIVEVPFNSKEATLWAWKHPHSATHDITYTLLQGDIRMFDVDFGYNENKIVLHNISLYAKPGQKVAFVGATGAGKTTITNLLNRFYDIADGKIRYDGININKISKKDLRKSLGMVLQDTNLFTGTIMDNIRYGRLDATDEECIEAAKLANADSFITRLPQGYNTMLTNDGGNLSQGQRQLLSIARAAVNNAPVLILDEATSSIDTRTEAIVTEGMDNLMKGRTVFVIAHRLSTIQNSNVIMVLDHGRIIERGTHEDLIKEKGVYYQLYTGAFELE